MCDIDDTTLSHFLSYIERDRENHIYKIINYQINISFLSKTLWFKKNQSYQTLSREIEEDRKWENIW